MNESDAWWKAVVDADMAAIGAGGAQWTPEGHIGWGFGSKVK